MQQHVFGRFTLIVLGAALTFSAMSVVKLSGAADGLSSAFVKSVYAQNVVNLSAEQVDVIMNLSEDDLVSIASDGRVYVVENNPFRLSRLTNEGRREMLLTEPEIENALRQRDFVLGHVKDMQLIDDQLYLQHEHRVSRFDAQNNEFVVFATQLPMTRSVMSNHPSRTTEWQMFQPTPKPTPRLDYSVAAREHALESSFEDRMQQLRDEMNRRMEALQSRMERSKATFFGSAEQAQAQSQEGGGTQEQVQTNQLQFEGEIE